MKLKGLLTERKNLAAALQEAVGTPAKYTGAPRFQYVCGDYTILRDGSLEIEDGKADAAILKNLAEKGLIEYSVEDEEPSGITFPADGMEGHTLQNLVNTIAAREKLLNKAVGRANAFHVSPALLRQMQADNPDGAREFQDTVFRAGGENCIRGIKITPQAISFTGFPAGGEETEAHRILAEKMMQTAKTRRWIRPECIEAENEKYSFRVWMNSIGMKGTEYAEARAILLKRLSGNSAFRMKEQREAFNQNRRRKQPDVQETSDFIVL